MSDWRSWNDEPILSQDPPEPAPGLDGVPRSELALIEAAVPKLVDLAVRGPVVLTRNGHEAFVMLPLDIWRRLWLTGQGARVVQAEVVPPDPPADPPAPPQGRRRA